VTDLGRRPERSPRRTLLVIASGFVIGALLTELMALTLPASAARQFFITTVAASIGPLGIDLNVIALTIGPLILRVNFLSIVGILLVAWFARSLL
jgi:broad specificity phosphatase PhoE